MTRTIDGTPQKDQNRVISGLETVLQQYKDGLLSYYEALVFIHEAAKISLIKEQEGLDTIIIRAEAQRDAIREL